VSTTEKSRPLKEIVTSVRPCAPCAVVYNSRSGGLRVSLPASAVAPGGVEVNVGASGLDGATLEELTDGPEGYHGVAACITSDRERAERFIADTVRKRVRWLVVAGGDGTFLTVLNTLFRTAPPNEWPVLSVVPAGTTNFLAALLRQPRPKRVLKRVLRHPEVDALPRMGVRLLNVDGTLSVICGAGLFQRAASMYAEGAPRLVSPLTWSMLHLLGAGTGMRLTRWLQDLHEIELSNETGEPIRLPHGAPVGAVLCSAEERVADLWRSRLYLAKGPVQALVTGTKPTGLAREIIGYGLGRRRTPVHIAARGAERLAVGGGIWLFLDGEFVYFDNPVSVSVGPTIEIADLTPWKGRRKRRPRQSDRSPREAPAPAV